MSFSMLNESQIYEKYPHLAGKKNVRIFRAYLPMDIPSNEDRKKILTEDAVNKMRFRDMPVHFTEKAGNQHKTELGEYDEVGHILSKEIVEIEGIKYVQLDFMSHPITQEKFVEEIKNNKDSYAASWEIDDCETLENNERRYVKSGEFSGIAILKKTAAAFAGARVVAEKEDKEMVEDKDKVKVVEVKEVEVKIKADTSDLDRNLEEIQGKIKKAKEQKDDLEVERLKKENEGLQTKLDELNSTIEEDRLATIIKERKSRIPSDFLGKLSEDKAEVLDSFLKKASDDELELFLTPKSEAKPDEKPKDKLIGALNSQVPKEETEDDRLDRVYGKNR